MKQKRKIVLLMTDSQRFDMVGCYGNKEITTPNIDRLASEGMRFTKAYTTQPVCGPARSAIFTGTYPHSNGSWGNSMPLGDTIKTIGQRLNDNNIHCAYIGKWHLDGGDYFGLGKCADGWDPKYWYDMRCYLNELSLEDRLRSRKVATMKESPISEEFTFAHRCSNKAIDFLEKQGEEDFFLVVSYDEPHHPFLCPEPYASMYKDYEFPKSLNIWDTLEGKPEHQKIWAKEMLRKDKDDLKIKHPYFFGCNSYVDYEIGRVLDTINQYAPDALILYTSDHGDPLFSHSLNCKGPVMYEEITKIPFIVKCNGMIQKGTVCHHPTSHIDIVPTFMEAFELPLPKLLEGRSMMETLKNPEVKTNDIIFMEFNRYEVDHDGFGGYQPLRSAFDGRYKLVLNLMCEDELYDLKRDPEEMINLIHSPLTVEVRNYLHDEVLNWMNRTRDPFRSYYWERRPWREDAIEATWDYTSMTRQKENEEYEPRQLDYATGLEMVTSVRKK